MHTNYIWDACWCWRSVVVHATINYYYLLAGLNHFGIVPPAPNDDDAVVDDLNEPPALVVGLVTSSERIEPPTAPAPSLLPASSNCTSSLLSCDNPLNWRNIKIKEKFTSLIIHRDLSTSSKATDGVDNLSAKSSRKYLLLSLLSPSSQPKWNTAVGTQCNSTSRCNGSSFSFGGVVTAMWNGMGKHYFHLNGLPQA